MARAKLLPPKVWTGTIHGSEPNTSIGTSLRWTAQVRFKLQHQSKNHRVFVYGGTGSASYVVSGGDLCSYSASQTFSITPSGASMALQRTRNGWRYDLGVDASNELTVHTDCGEGGSADESWFLDPTLRTDHRLRPMPAGLGSISSTFKDGAYEVSWDLTGTPRRTPPG